MLTNLLTLVLPLPLPLPEGHGHGHGHGHQVQVRWPYKSSYKSKICKANALVLVSFALCARREAMLALICMPICKPKICILYIEVLTQKKEKESKQFLSF